MKCGDIDIDVANRDKVLSFIKHVNASSFSNDGKNVSHNVGIYLQDIPRNPNTDRATIDYKVAEYIGYKKIDVLNNSIYDGVDDHQHLERLCDVSTVDWDMLECETIVNNIPHLNGHFHIVQKISPRSIEDLSIVLALIRPGKRHLLDENLDYIKEHIWKKPKDGYFFKKSHAVSYALSLVVKMNLMAESVF
jgi:hypothetical protein